MQRLSRVLALAATCVFALAVGVSAPRPPTSTSRRPRRKARSSGTRRRRSRRAQKIAKLFEGETGIKVEMFRSGGSAILRRFLQEAQAGRIAADVMTTSDPAATAALARKGTFVAFKPKNFEKVVEEGRDKDGYFVAQRLNLMTIYVRSDKVAAADLPKTWGDLTDARYKGKLVMTDPSFTALQLTVVGMMSKNLGWDYYEKLRKNDIMIVQGNQQVSDNIKRGERLIAVGALDSLRGGRPQGRPPHRHHPAGGRHVRNPVADGRHQGLAQPERRHAVRRVHDRRRRSEAVPGGWRLCRPHRHRAARPTVPRSTRSR